MASDSRLIENNFEELDRILEAMKSEDISLEEAFKLYEKGMKLVRQCNDKIDKVEKKISIIEGNMHDE